MNTHNRIICCLLVAFSIAGLDPAFAQDAGWVQPAQQGVTSLTTNLVLLGGGIIGLSIVAYGLWAAMTQRIDWARLWVYFVAGLLVTGGPAAMTWLIQKFQGSTGY